MATIKQIVAQIRTALYGKDVRENIAQGIEKCYSDVTAGVTEADAAASRATDAAVRGETINSELGDNADDLVIVNQNQPSLDKEFNKIWIKPDGTEYQVPTWEEFSDLKSAITFDESYERVATNFIDISACTTGAAFKGNRTGYDTFEMYTGSSYTNYVSSHPVHLPAGTYYIRMPYSTGSAVGIYVWQDYAPNEFPHDYPFGVYQKVLAKDYSVTRVNKNSVNVFEYSITFTVPVIVGISTVKATSNEYVNILAMSNVNFLGTDEVISTTDGMLAKSHDPNAKTAIDQIAEMNTYPLLKYDDVLTGKTWSLGGFDDKNATGGVMNFTNNNTRCHVGPFRLKHSITIVADSNIKYEVAYLFDEDMQTKGRTITGGFRTGHTAIIGATPETENYIKYWMVLAFTDDRAITNLDAMKDKIKFIISDEANPLGLVQTNTFNASAYTPRMDSASSPLRLMGYTEGDVKIDLKWSDNLFCSTNRSPLFGAPVASQEKAKHFLIGKQRNGTGDIPISDYYTFEALYNGLEIKAVPMDFNDFQNFNVVESIDGSFDPIVKATAVDNGQGWATAFASRIEFDMNGVSKYAHVPSMKIYYGHAYVAFMATTDTNVEKDDTTTIFLADVDLSDDSVTFTEIAGKSKPGTYGHTDCCSDPTIYIDNGVIHIYFFSLSSTEMSNGGEFHYEYDISTGTLTEGVCYFAIGEDEYEFSKDNINTYLTLQHGIKNITPAFNMSELAPDGSGNYYIAISGDSIQNGITPIFRTSDFETFEYFTAVPLRCGSDCEMPLVVWRGYLYGASRHYYNNATMCIWKMDISTKDIIESIQIPDCATRPTWFKNSNGSKLYLAHGMSGRNTIEFLDVQSTRLAQTYPIMYAHFSNMINYNSIVIENGVVYVAVQTRRNNAQIAYFHFENEVF